MRQYYQILSPICYHASEPSSQLFRLPTSPGNYPMIFFKSDSCLDRNQFRTPLLNIIRLMRTQQHSQLPRNINFKLLLYFGLILSETQILVNLKFHTNVFVFPNFTLAYFVLTTAYLVFAFTSYAFFANRRHALTLEVFQHLGLPMSVLLITLLARSSGLAGFKAVAVVLLVIQSLVIGITIIYFGSLFPEIAHISILNKLTRLVKLNLIAVLPLLVSEQIVVAIVVAVCQLVSTGAFFFKFTYQRLAYEYLLLAGIFCGMLSALESIFEVVFGLGYIFFGELASLFFYFEQENYLRTIIEIKHINNCQSRAENKTDDDRLAGFLFINECLFPSKQSLPLSQTAKNEGFVQATQLVERLDGFASAKEGSDHQILESNAYHKSNALLLRLLEVYYSCFHQTTCFPAFQFLTRSALDLGAGYANRALIIFYSQNERQGNTKSLFQTGKYELLYHRIRTQIQTRETDKQEIKYIQFSDNLSEVNLQIEACFSNELRLLEYLSEEKKSGFETADRLLQRHKLKRGIRARLDECFSKEAYFNSNEFKFLFILYEATIERRIAGLKEILKQRFLASEVQRLREENTSKNIVILSGFNHGEIVNSNQTFKTRFGFTLSSAGRSNISEFLLSERQKAKHNQFMSNFLQVKAQSHAHDEYQCQLGLEQQFNAIKLKAISSFTIAVRIYYEHQNGFNYICNLIERQKEIENTNLLLLKRDCNMLTNKGLRFNFINSYKIDQLGEALEVCEVSFNVSQTNLRQLSTTKQIHRKEKMREQIVLKEKTEAVQVKLLDSKRMRLGYSLANAGELLLWLLMAVLLTVMFVSASTSVSSLGTVVSKKHSPVAQALLLRNRLILQQEIISFIAQTPYFPRNLCSRYGIPDIHDYTMEVFKDDLYNGTDEFLSLITLPSNGQLDSHLYVRQFISPYLRTFPLSISFQKYMELLKVYAFMWLDTYKTSALNVYFYTNTFPNILINGTLEDPTALTSLLSVDQNIYVTNFLATLSYLKAVACIGVGLVGLFLVFIRLWDNLLLVDYLIIVESLHLDIIKARGRELKSALGQLHRLRANYVSGVEFSPDYVVSIRSEKRESEDIELNSFSDWHVEGRQDGDPQQSGCVMEQSKELLDYHEEGKDQSAQQSRLMRTVLYLRIYLILLAIGVIAVAVLSGNIVDMQRDEVNTIMSCHRANMALLAIQQKITNLVGYNWVKVLSLYQKMNMTASNKVFDQAINSLLANKYQDYVQAAYTRDFADTVLNSNVCKYFNNAKACRAYRNGLFGSGFSMLVPFMLKEEMEINQISQDPSYYIHNLCDKTWLLFEGVIPMTTEIPKRGYALMLDGVSSGFTSAYIELAVAGLALLLVTVLWQCLRVRRGEVIREEALSLDTVDSLYSMAEYKPHFNRVYYS